MASFDQLEGIINGDMFFLEKQLRYEIPRNQVAIYATATFAGGVLTVEFHARSREILLSPADRLISALDGNPPGYVAFDRICTGARHV